MPTIAVSTPIAPTKVGPGYQTAFLLSGAPAATDFIEGNLVEHATGNTKLISAQKLFNLSTTQLFIWGYANTTQFGRAGQHFDPVAQGDAIDLVVNWRAANLTIIATQTTVGWSWDSINEAWYLASLMLTQLVAPSGSIPQLSTTYHNSP